MNKEIKALNNKLANISDNEFAIKQELQLAWNKVFDDMSVLRDAITKVEASNEYTWESRGEDICSWIRFDTKSFDDCAEYLKEYLRNEHYVEIDFENDALLYSMGPSIIINEDGDVLDQDGDKWFINKDDYRDEDSGDLNEGKRNELIEAYMEKTGCYPGVFRTDRHGNVFAVSTKA
jgi:hypothetical protein